MTTTNTNPLPGDHQAHHALMGALNEIKIGMNNLSRDVEAISKGQDALKAQVDKIKENLDGDGSLEDPGIAGTVRSLKAWKKRDEAKIALFDGWRTSQSAIWRQILIWLNLPLGLAVAALWHLMTSGPPTPPAPGIK